MARFTPHDYEVFDEIEKPGIRIGRCKLAKSATIALVNGGEILVGNNFSIGDNAKILTFSGKIVIGHHVSVQHGCILYGHNGLGIGSFVSIAAYTVIIPANHNFRDLSRPIQHQGTSGKGILIGDDVWIGAGCKILDNVMIGKGCVVGAGSVVTKSIPDYSIVAGVPAKVIKMRK